MPDASPFPEIDETFHATTRYLAALTELTGTGLDCPSALPGWTRAHVVAHLSRNADALTRVLHQAGAGRPAWMYESSSARDRDIEDTVRGADLETLLDDARISSERFRLAAADFPRDLLEATYTRTPADTDAVPVATVGPGRRTEVEVHHADLLLDYKPSAWPEDFSRSLVRRRRDELATDGHLAITLRPTDTEDRWQLGDRAGPEITGTVGDLAWWLVGRGGGSGLVSSTGELPHLPRWR